MQTTPVNHSAWPLLGVDGSVVVVQMDQWSVLSGCGRVEVEI